MTAVVVRRSRCCDECRYWELVGEEDSGLARGWRYEVGVCRPERPGLDTMTGGPHPGWVPACSAFREHRADARGGPAVERRAR